MKVSIPTTKEIEITHVIVTLPVRYEQEDMPKDFPMRNGDVWRAKIRVDDGVIEGWPKGKQGAFYMKVVDGGEYELLDASGVVVCERQDYVPHGLIPGEYGDYANLKIDTDGRVTNWPQNPDVSEFFTTEC